MAMSTRSSRIRKRSTIGLPAHRVWRHHWSRRAAGQAWSAAAQRRSRFERIQDAQQPARGAHVVHTQHLDTGGATMGGDREVTFQAPVGHRLLEERAEESLA